MHRTNRILSRVVPLAMALAACSPRPAADGTTAATGDSAKAPQAPPSVTAPAASLTGTYWRLVALADRAVSAGDSAREAHLVLRPQSKQLTGSGGCNRMFGVYELNGESLRFSGVGSTKMACQSGMDVETAFLPALLRVARWRVTGDQLELTDSAGGLVARFAAKPAK